MKLALQAWSLALPWHRLGSVRVYDASKRAASAQLVLTIELNAMRKKIKPVHPGEILREEFMAPLKLSMNRMAMDLRVPVTRIADIVHERRGITAVQRYASRLILVMLQFFG
jgi:addiction module HigA family antidote